MLLQIIPATHILCQTFLFCFPKKIRVMLAYQETLDIQD